jgi:hypothetical protein
VFAPKEDEAPGGALSRLSKLKQEECTGRIADFRRRFSVATLICVSNNSDVEVIGSLLLVHCVLLPRAVCLFLSADEISS